MIRQSPHRIVLSLGLLAALALSPAAAAALPRPAAPERLSAFEAGLRVAVLHLGNLLASLWAADTAGTGTPPQQDGPDDSGTDTGMSLDPNG